MLLLLLVVRAVARIVRGLTLGLAGRLLLLLLARLTRLAVDENVGNAAAFAVILIDGLVLGVLFRELVDDVPCVEKAGDLDRGVRSRATGIVATTASRVLRGGTE